MKEMLENYMNYKAEIKTKEYKIKELELEEISVGSSNLSVNGDIKPKGYILTGTEKKIINNADKIGKLKKEIEELQAKINMIDGLLDTLNSFNKRLLELRYKHNLSLESIAGECGRSVKSIQRTLMNCIKKLDKKCGTIGE